MKEYIRPSEYAKLKGINYRTAVAHFNRGWVEGFRDPNTDRISMKNPEWEPPTPTSNGPPTTVLYARVSSTTNKASLDGQIERLRDYASARGYRVVGEVKEIASGLNDNRRKLNGLLTKDDWDVLLVEHKDRLTRFGYQYFETLLSRTGQRVETINEVEEKEKTQEIMDDFVAIITSFAGRIYGANRRARTKEIIRAVEADDGV